jgi:hypothetical protein
MRTNRAPLGLLVAALLALTLAVTTAAPPPAQAGEGTEARGVAADTSRVTPMDLARATQLASKMVQDWLGELFRTGEGTYQAGCVSNGFKCVAGTGFDVNVTAGRCLYDYATGASAWVSRTRVLHLLTAEAATDWDANPGADTYYVHVGYGETTSDGVEWPDPVITVDTDASLTGTYTVCSIVVGGSEPDATTYTINDLRTVLPGPGYFPGDISIGDDLAVGGDANVVGTLTGGPVGTPMYSIDGATGVPTFGAAGAELGGVVGGTAWFFGSLPTPGAVIDGIAGTAEVATSIVVGPHGATTILLDGATGSGDFDGLVTAALGVAVTTVGVDLEDGVPVLFDTADAVSIAYDAVGVELDVTAPTVDFSGDVDIAGDLSPATLTMTGAGIGAAGDLTARTVTITVPSAPAVPAVPGFVSSGWAFGRLDCTPAGAPLANVCTAALSPVSLGLTFPAGAMQTHCEYIVTTGFTSNAGSDLATIALDIGATSLVAATAINVGTTWDDVNAPEPTAVDGTPANYAYLATSETVEATIDVEEITAGVLWVACEYVILP